LPGCDQLYSSLSLHQARDPQDAVEFKFEEGAIQFAEAYFAVALFDVVQEVAVIERTFALKDLDDCQVEGARPPDLVH